MLVKWEFDREMKIFLEIGSQKRKIWSTGDLRSPVFEKKFVRLRYYITHTDMEPPISSQPGPNPPQNARSRYLASLPDWILRPEGIPTITPYSVDVLKDGIVLETIELTPTVDKTFFMCGRQADLCEIEMAHASVSRVHAVLQYNSDGVMLLQDLHSAQGTRVNKKLIAAREWCVVHPGDQLTVGESK